MGNTENQQEWLLRKLQQPDVVRTGIYLCGCEVFIKASDNVSVTDLRRSLDEHNDPIPNPIYVK